MSNFSPRQAVVICTRNRPKELAETLESVGRQSGAENRLVLVVDGSDRKEASQNARAVENGSSELPFRYHHYQGSPAQTRQRNAGVDLLPDTVNLIHFIDDDVTLKNGYFEALETTMNHHPSLLGAGGLIHEPDKLPSKALWPHRLFFLDASKPGRVLPSGQTSFPWSKPGGTPQSTEWLSTCSCCYRRTVFGIHRFDAEVEGPSPTLHDLDFSYRIAQNGPLVIVPSAQCIHRRSSNSRLDVQAASRERVVRRYWFVEKNLSSLPYYLAFWWSMFGKFLILLVSTHPDSSASFRGFLRGIQIVWNRNHGLLRGT